LLNSKVKFQHKRWVYNKIWNLISYFYLPHIANDSPPLQAWYIGLGTKPRGWAPLYRDTRKGITRI